MTWPRPTDIAAGSAPGRRRPYADIAGWLALAAAAVAVLLLSTRAEDGHLVPEAAAAYLRALGLHPQVKVPAPINLGGTVVMYVGAALAVVAGAAGVLAHTRDLVTRRSWWVLQGATATLGSVWTAGLVLVVGLRPIAAARGERPPLGGAAADLDRAIAADDPVLAVLLVALVSGLAAAVLNAGVQSLCGEVQARRFAPVAALAPLAGWYGEGSTWLVLLLTSATLTAAAMASERGRGPLWTVGLGTVSGVLLGLAVLSAYQSAALGVAMLGIFFLRRRTVTVLVAGGGVAVVLLVAAAAGWSWTAGLRAATDAERIGPLLAGLVVGCFVTLAVGGPVLLAALVKLRGTPGWPFLLGAAGTLLFALVTRSAAGTWLGTVAPVLPLLMVAVVAPRRPAGVAYGPQTATFVVGVGMSVALSALLAAA